jgi:glutathione S-transferase
MTERPITLFHAPHTRSSSVLALLEELGAEHVLKVLDRGKSEHLAPAFRAVNPLGKVPALQDGSAIVTETVAIFLHLADLFPAAGLAPGLQDPLRGPYLRWMVFYAAAFEPALVDKHRGHEPGMRALSPYGSYDEVIDTVSAGLAPGPWLLGSTKSAADILWGTALRWTMQFKLVPPRPEFVDYARRVSELPGVTRARERDAALAAKQG